MECDGDDVYLETFKHHKPKKAPIGHQHQVDHIPLPTDI